MPNTNPNKINLTQTPPAASNLSSPTVQLPAIKMEDPHLLLLVKELINLNKQRAKQDATLPSLSLYENFREYANEFTKAIHHLDLTPIETIEMSINSLNNAPYYAAKDFLRHHTNPTWLDYVEYMERVTKGHISTHRHQNIWSRQHYQQPFSDFAIMKNHFVNERFGHLDKKDQLGIVLLGAQYDLYEHLMPLVENSTIKNLSDLVTEAYKYSNNNRNYANYTYKNKPRTYYTENDRREPRNYQNMQRTYNNYNNNNGNPNNFNNNNRPSYNNNQPTYSNDNRRTPPKVTFNNPFNNPLATEREVDDAIDKIRQESGYYENIHKADAETYVINEESEYSELEQNEITSEESTIEESEESILDESEEDLE